MINLGSLGESLHVCVFQLLPIAAAGVWHHALSAASSVGAVPGTAAGSRLHTDACQLEILDCILVCGQLYVQHCCTVRKNILSLLEERCRNTTANVVCTFLLLTLAVIIYTHCLSAVFFRILPRWLVLWQRTFGYYQTRFTAFLPS